MYVSINGCSFRIWLRKKCSRSITRSTTASKEAGDNGVGGGCTRRSAGSRSTFSGCLISEADGWLAEPSCASDQTAQLATMVETRKKLLKLLIVPFKSFFLVSTIVASCA